MFDFILQVVLTIYLYFFQAQLNSKYKELINYGSDESTTYSKATQQVFPDFVGILELSSSYAKKSKRKDKISTSMLNDITTEQKMLKK